MSSHDQELLCICDVDFVGVCLLFNVLKNDATFFIPYIYKPYPGTHFHLSFQDRNGDRIHGRSQYKWHLKLFWHWNNSIPCFYFCFFNINFSFWIYFLVGKTISQQNNDFFTRGLKYKTVIIEQFYNTIKPYMYIEWQNCLELKNAILCISWRHFQRKMQFSMENFP